MTDSSTFPFLRLQLIVQLLVVDNLNLSDLFKLSLLSQRLMKIVKAANRKVPKLHWQLKCHLDYHEIVLQSDRDEKLLTIGFNLPANYRPIPPITRFYSQSSEDNLKRIEDISVHLMDIFKFGCFDVSIAHAFNVSDCFVWKHRKSFQELRMNIYEATLILRAADLKFVLDNLEMKKFRCDSGVEKGFQYSKPLRSEIISLRRADWLTLEAFLNTDAKQWNVNSDSVPVSYLNAFIKKWLSGSLNNLERLYIHMESTVSEAKLREILEGIETFPYDPCNRPNHFQNINFEGGRDMRRGDGMLATAALNNNKLFNFVVWHPKFLTAPPIVQKGYYIKYG